MPVSVLLLNQYFAPDIAPTAQLLGDLAEDLVGAGMDVTALASSARYAGGQGRLPRHEVWRGVNVHRVRATGQGRSRQAARVLDYATYVFPAAILSLARHRPDVVVCLSTPPLVAALGAALRWRGARFVYKVEDLYPEIGFALGVLSERSVLGRVLSRASRWVLRTADAVVGLDGAMAAALEARGARRVEVIPNWADGARLHPDATAGARFRSEHGLGDRFIVLYAGNHGLAHRFDAVLEAARLLAVREPRALFLFVGDGPRRGEVRDAAAGSPNMTVMEYQPGARLNALLNAGDLHLVTVRDEVAGMLFPSKYPAALAVGKPVLLAGGRGTAIAEEIAREGLGFACRHEPGEIAHAVLEGCNDPAGLRAAGDAGRRVFEERYERRSATGRWADLITALVREPAAGAAGAG